MKSFSFQPPGQLLLCLAAVLLFGCTEYVEHEPAAAPRLTAEQMSAYVPTASITVDEAAFERMVARPFDDIEVPASLTLWRAGDRVCTQEGVEIQVKGNYSAGLPSKSLGVKFDKSFRNREDNFLKVPLLKEDHSLARIKSFRLRNGGSAFETTLIKDLAFARMVIASDLRVTSLYGEPAATYVNDRFYALHNLRTENNQNGLSRILDIDEDRLGIAVVDDGLDELDVKDGPAGPWRRLEASVANENTAAVLADIDQRGFADFIVAGAMFATQDWPFRNVRLYRVDEGPVAFVFYDFDFAGQAYTNRRPYDYIERSRDGLIRRMFVLCYEDAGFRALLERRYDEVRASGQLSAERFREVVDALSRVYDPVIEHQVAAYGFPKSKVAWYVELEAMVGDYGLRYWRLPKDFK